MKNFIHSGETLTLTAPTGGVVGGAPVKIGALVVVPVVSVAQTLPFEGRISGLFSLPSDTGTAWAEGDTLYWDNTAKVFTKTTTSNTKCAVAAAAKASADVTASVRLIPTI